MKVRRLCVGFAAGMACGSISLALWALAGALPPHKATPEKADSILILKKDHLMELLAGGKVIRGYKVALGQGRLAPKVREGDGRTPEGHYIIDKSTSTNTTRLCTSPIPTPRTAGARRSWASLRAGPS
jgi:hypothetical protein